MQPTAGNTGQCRRAEPLSTVSFGDAENGTIVGADGTILCTRHGGTHWTNQPSGTRNWLGGVCFVDANTGTAVGGGGTILRTTTDGASWIVHNNMPDVPERRILSQNYPNPFNPTTSIKFEVPSSKVVTLKVFDVLGREVAILLNEEKSAGIHTVQWDASGVSSGVYFYRIKAGNFVQTKRMMVVR